MIRYIVNRYIVNRIKSGSRFSNYDSRFSVSSHRSTAKPMSPENIGIHGYAAKTLESKETRASRRSR